MGERKQKGNKHIHSFNCRKKRKNKERKNGSVAEFFF